MSADGWKQCPRCKDKARKAAEAEVDRVAQLYGRVPAAEYEQARGELMGGPEEAVRRLGETFHDRATCPCGWHSGWQASPQDAASAGRAHAFLGDQHQAGPR